MLLCLPTQERPLRPVGEWMERMSTQTKKDSKRSPPLQPKILPPRGAPPLPKWKERASRGPSHHPLISTTATNSLPPLSSSSSPTHMPLSPLPSHPRTHVHHHHHHRHGMCLRLGHGKVVVDGCGRRGVIGWEPFSLPSCELASEASSCPTQPTHHQLTPTPHSNQQDTLQSTMTQIDVPKALQPT